MLYSFALDGKELSEIAAVSRVRRTSTTEAILGYQRPEVLSHIAEIRDYLESSEPMIPNAIVIAFDPSVSFEPSDIQPIGPAYTRVGALSIPVNPLGPKEEKPGWVVDGQQRLAAVRDAAIKEFPLCITAFITADDHRQREQFILVNSTKPLPKGLIYELLPETDGHLPSALERKRLPASLLERLNRDKDSPLYAMIRTATNPSGVIKDNSILRMLEHSLTDGALHQFRASASRRSNTHAMLALLKTYWGATRYVFADAWGQSPRRSRLMHGAGVVSMGFIMDAMMDEFDRGYVPSEDEVRERLRPLASTCRWTSGTWTFSDGSRRRWDELQNTPRDIQLVSDYLLQQYRKTRKSTRRNRSISPARSARR